MDSRTSQPPSLRDNPRRPLSRRSFQDYHPLSLPNDVRCGTTPTKPRRHPGGLNPVRPLNIEAEALYLRGAHPSYLWIR